MYKGAEFEVGALANSEPLKLILCHGWNVVKLFNTQYQTSSSVDDLLKPNDTVLW